MAGRGRGRGRGRGPRGVGGLRGEDGELLMVDDKQQEGPPQLYPAVAMPDPPKIKPAFAEETRLRRELVDGWRASVFHLDESSFARGPNGERPEVESLHAQLQLDGLYFPEELYSTRDAARSARRRGAAVASGSGADFRSTSKRAAQATEEVQFDRLEELVRMEASGRALAGAGAGLFGDGGAGGPGGGADDDDEAAVAEEDEVDEPDEVDQEDDDYHQGQSFEDDEEYAEEEDGADEGAMY